MENLLNESRNEGRMEGRIEAEQNMVIRLVQKGRSLTDIIDATDWSQEQILAFLQSKNIQLAQ